MGRLPFCLNLTIKPTKDQFPGLRWKHVNHKPLTLSLKQPPVHIVAASPDRLPRLHIWQERERFDCLHPGARRNCHVSLLPNQISIIMPPAFIYDGNRRLRHLSRDDDRTFFHGKTVVTFAIDSVRRERPVGSHVCPRRLSTYDKTVLRRKSGI